MKVVKVIKISAINAPNQAKKCLMAKSVKIILIVRVDTAKVESRVFVKEHADRRELEGKSRGVIGYVARVLAVNMGKKSVKNVYTVTRSLKAVHVLIIVIARITLANLKRLLWELGLLLVAMGSASYFLHRSFF